MASEAQRRAWRERKRKQRSSPEGRAKANAAQAKYLRTEKGFRTQRRYRRSPGGRAAQRRYQTSEKAHLTHVRWASSERGRMLRWFAAQRARDLAGRRHGYTGDRVDRAIDAAIRAANARVYAELREVERAGH